MPPNLLAKARRAGTASAITLCIAVGVPMVGLAAPITEVRPTGPNCDLIKPPADSGEETGHGVLLQAFPRIKALRKSYSGCQAVFVTTPKRSASLAWLIELREGDPIRIWSEDESIREALACRVRQGKVISGDPAVCKRHSIKPLPTMPAGCSRNNQDNANCEYDAE